MIKYFQTSIHFFFQKPDKHEKNIAYYEWPYFMASERILTNLFSHDAIKLSNICQLYSVTQ